MHGWKFEAAHSLFLSMKADDFKFTVNFSITDNRLMKYLKGETLAVAENELNAADSLPSPGDTIVVCLDEFPVGQTRMMPGNLLKNLYSPGWRKLI